MLDGWPPPGWLMVACDVGQGDGLVLDAGPGAAVVIDTGPDPVRMDDCLRSLHISRVLLLVITHFHLDHVGGVGGVVRGRTVDQVVAGPLAEPVTGLTRPAAGDRVPAGPNPTGRLDASSPGRFASTCWARRVVLHDTRSDPNNDSLVLRATVGGVRILLPGDAEIEGQADVVDSGVDLHADVLKVAHHGSAYFDPAFYTAVHARVALISVGAGNRLRPSGPAHRRLPAPPGARPWPAPIAAARWQWPGTAPACDWSPTGPRWPVARRAGERRRDATDAGRGGAAGPGTVRADGAVAAVSPRWLPQWTHARPHRHRR